MTTIREQLAKEFGHPDYYIHNCQKNRYSFIVASNDDADAILTYINIMLGNCFYAVANCYCPYQDNSITQSRHGYVHICIYHTRMLDTELEE